MRPNKANKRIRSISYMLLVIHENQKKKASNSYLKVIDRLPVVAQEIKDSLPEYTTKETNQIRRIVVDFANRNFGSQGHDSVKFSSFLMAIAEKEQNQLAGEHKAEMHELLDKVHRLASRMNDYWDRPGNKHDLYRETEIWVSRWDMV